MRSSRSPRSHRKATSRADQSHSKPASAETAADAVVVGVLQDAPLSRRRRRGRRRAGRRHSRARRAQGVLPAAATKRPRCWCPSAGQASAGRGAGPRSRSTPARPFAPLGHRRPQPGRQAALDVAFFLDDGWPAEWTEAAWPARSSAATGQDLYRAEKNRHPFETLAWAGGTRSGDRQRADSGRGGQPDAAAGQRAGRRDLSRNVRRARRRIRTGRTGWRSRSGTKIDWTANAAARCWPSPRARAGRRGW